ncbi:hypothetical protein ACJX0J_013933, partial [Zea mays]
TSVKKKFITISLTMCYKIFFLTIKKLGIKKKIRELLKQLFIKSSYGRLIF